MARSPCVPKRKKIKSQKKPTTHAPAVSVEEGVWLYLSVDSASVSHRHFCLKTTSRGKKERAKMLFEAVVEIF